MYSRIRPWFVRNQHRITWFIVGTMVISIGDYLARGDLTNAALCTIVAVANIVMDRQEMV